MNTAPNHGEDHTGDEQCTVLTFDLEGDRYCVKTDTIASVLGVGDDSALTDAADPWNAGAITVANERVRVIDLPRVFGSSFQTPARVDAPKLIVFDTTDDSGRHYGWLIDDVGTTRTVDADTLEPPYVSTTHVKGRLEIEGAPVIWLDERTIHE